MATRIPQILSVPSGLDAQLTKFLQSVKETVEIREGRRGISGDRFVRRADLKDLDMLVASGLTYTALTEHCTDPIDPPTNFVVTKGHWCNYLSWDNPTDEMFAGVEVWCHSANARGDATLIAIVTNPGQTYVHYMSDFTNPHYYWIRARSFNQDVYSMWLPRGLTGGEVISGDTTIGETVEKMIDILKGTDPDTYGAATTYYKDDLVQYADSSGNLRRYKCIDDDSGTGISGTVPTNTDYWEHIGILMVGNIDGVATVGIDGNLVVDGTVLARHVAADQIDTSHMNALEAFIGLTIQSESFETGVAGWQINKDGDVEFNSGTFRGATVWSAITGDDKPADGADVTPTTRLFTDATTKANIEAWRKAGSPTYLDGSHIYTQSITADKYAELRQTYVFTGDDSLDASYPMEMPFRIVSETTTIIAVRVSFKIMPFRAYSTAAASGGGQTSSSSGTSHTHTIPVGSPGVGYAMYVYNGTLTSVQAGNVLSSAPSSVDHKHTVADHTHDITFGIYEEDNSPTVHFHVDNGAGYGSASGNYTTDQADINILSSPTAISGTGWKGIRFDTTARCRISVIIECKSDVTA